jgi:hypothetical protein
LTGATVLPLSVPNVLGANSDASSAAAGLGGLANSLANAAAAALGGGIATTNTNSVSNVVNGLSTTLGNAGSASLSPFGSAAGFGNVAAAALGGLATGNTASNTFSGLDSQPPSILEAQLPLVSTPFQHQHLTLLLH